MSALSGIGPAANWLVSAVSVDDFYPPVRRLAEGAGRGSGASLPDRPRGFSRVRASKDAVLAESQRSVRPVEADERNRGLGFSVAAARLAIRTQLAPLAQSRVSGLR